MSTYPHSYTPKYHRNPSRKSGGRYKSKWGQNLECSESTYLYDDQVYTKLWPYSVASEVCCILLI